MTSFSVHKELGGGTVIPVVQIYNVPERLFNLFPDMRNKYEKHKDEELTRSEICKRVWWAMITGTFP